MDLQKMVRRDSAIFSFNPMHMPDRQPKNARSREAFRWISMAQRHPWRNKTTKEKYQRSPRKRKTKTKSLAQTMLRAPCEDDRTTPLKSGLCGGMVTRRCSADRNSKDSNKPKKPMQPHKLRVKGTALESRDQKEIELINQCSLQYSGERAVSEPVG